jgi:hypothetical protein
MTKVDSAIHHVLPTCFITTHISEFKATILRVLLTLLIVASVPSLNIPGPPSVKEYSRHVAVIVCEARDSVDRGQDLLRSSICADAHIDNKLKNPFDLPEWKMVPVRNKVPWSSGYHPNGHRHVDYTCQVQGD